MRLTRRTDYALRVLMHLAVNGDGLATISEIAERYEISRHHLARAAWGLGRAGFIVTVRGKGGGLRLARAAEEISIGAVARHTERVARLAGGAPGGVDSPRTASCRVYRRILAEAGEAFFVALDRYTIDDLIGGNRKSHASSRRTRRGGRVTA